MFDDKSYEEKIGEPKHEFFLFSQNKKKIN